MPRGKKASSAHAVTRALTRNILGHKLLPSRSPPEVCVAPWYQIVAVDLITSASAGTLYQVADIAKYAVTQHGWVNSGGARLPVFIRIKTVKIWATSAVSTASVALECFDFTSRSKASTVIFRDHAAAGKATWARVGYHWPLVQTETVFDSGDNFNVCRVVTNSTATVHFSVEIRGSLAQDLPERLAAQVRAMQLSTATTSTPEKSA